MEVRVIIMEQEKSISNVRSIWALSVEVSHNSGHLLEQEKCYFTTWVLSMEVRVIMWSLFGTRKAGCYREVA